MPLYMINGLEGKDCTGNFTFFLKMNTIAKIKWFIGEYWFPLLNYLNSLAIARVSDKLHYH